MAGKLKELDRFDKNGKRNLSIKVKISLLSLFSIACSIIITAEIAMNIFNKKFLEATIEDLDHTAHGIEFIAEDWRDNLYRFVKVMSKENEIIETFESGNSSAAIRIANQQAEDFAVDLIAFADKSGKIIGGVGIKTGENVSSSHTVKSALGGKEFQAYEEMGNIKFGIITAAPVKSNGETIGAIIMGYSLVDDGEGSFIEIVKQNYNVDFTVFKGKVRYQTTLGQNMIGTELANQAIVDQVLGRGEEYSGPNKINGKSYYSNYIPLIDDDGDISGMLFVAKSVEVVNAVRRRTQMIVTPCAALTLLIFFVVTFLYIRKIIWRINNVTKFLAELETENADLTKRCALFYRDEIGDLIIHFDNFVDKLQSIVKDVKESKTELADSGADLSGSMAETQTSITEIIANIQSIHGQIQTQDNGVYEANDSVNKISDEITTLNTMIENQSASVTQASAAIEQMIGNIASVNNSVDKMSESFKSLELNAEVGFQKQKDVSEKIQQMEAESKMLQEANTAIASIASQTNLLAMNAAIEAAHAGEAGKGFAVVADEIRKLSETSTKQSKTIGAGIKKIRSSIDLVVNSSNESSDALSVVSNKINETDQLVIQIKAAMDEQNSGSKQIIDALHNMNDTTIEVRTASNDIGVQKENVLSEMNTLTDSTIAMKGSMDEISEGAKQINETGAALSTIADQVQGAITKIGSQIDLFTV